MSKTLTNQPAFKDVPAPVVERITSQAKLGVGLILLGGLMAGGAIYLVASVKGFDWKLFGLMMVIPFFLCVVGANLVSQKITAAAIQSIAAFVRALKGSNGK